MQGIGFRLLEFERNDVSFELFRDLFVRVNSWIV